MGRFGLERRFKLDIWLGLGFWFLVGDGLFDHHLFGDQHRFELQLGFAQHRGFHRVGGLFDLLGLWGGVLA